MEMSNGGIIAPAGGRTGHTHPAEEVDAIPVGSLMPYVGASAPDGWLLCDGSEKLTSDFPALSALCGTAFGSAAEGNFRLPDLRGRFPVGYLAATPMASLGSTGGNREVTLTAAQIPAHSHEVAAHGHTVANHSHVIPTHDHTTSTHSHSIPSHGHSTASHSHTAGSHTHSVPNHQHSGSVTTSVASKSHNHSHTLSGGTADSGAHRHGMGTISATSGDRGNHSHGGVVTGGTSNTNTTGGGSLTRVSTLTTGSTGTELAHNHGIPGSSGWSGQMENSADHSHTFSSTSVASAATSMEHDHTATSTLTIDNSGATTTGTPSSSGGTGGETVTVQDAASTITGANTVTVNDKAAFASETATLSISQASASQTGAFGDGQEVLLLPPFLALTFIIKAG